MTADQLQTIEAELSRRGYRKQPARFTSSESWAWFKTFNKRLNKDDIVINGYQIAFRVWDFRQFVDRGAPPYALDMWTSPLGSDFRMDFTANWESIADIPTFERMAADFNAMVRKYAK